TGMIQSNATKHGFGRAPFRQVVEHWIVRGASIGHQHQQRKLIALSERHHAGAHAEHTCILDQEGGAHSAETEAARNCKSFLFMSCSYGRHARLLIDADKNFAKPAIWNGNDSAKAKPLECVENLGRPMRV